MGPRARHGRPTTLSPQIAKRLTTLVAEMGSIAGAARWCGLAQATVQGWITRGEERHRAGRAAIEPYVSFALGIQKALGRWERGRLKAIRRAGDKHPQFWSASAWQLERRFRDEYGRRDHIDVGATLTVVEMRVFFGAVLRVLERYVPATRLESEVENLIATVDELTGTGGGVVDRPSLAHEVR
jgi:hypothetical protein